ncbi:hypothetical protein V6Z11_D09G249000 [Gossypium hirsutum]
MREGNLCFFLYHQSAECETEAAEINGNTRNIY